MKRYNLSKIMKQAHSIIKYAGKSLSVALKEAWSYEKYDVEKLELEASYKNWSVGMKNTNMGSDYNSLDIPCDAFYNKNSRGYMGAQYCGD